MGQLSFVILGSQHGKLITVQANIDGHPVNFMDVNKGIYLKRSKTYQAPSKRTRLLSWLHKNGNYAKAAPSPKKALTKQTVRQANKVAPKSVPVVPISLGAMVIEVERQLLAKGYTLVKKGKSTPMTVCSHTTKNGNGKVIEQGCGKKSMIGAFKDSPAKFIGVCYNRYNVASSCEVVKVWGDKQARAWLDKQKAA